MKVKKYKIISFIAICLSSLLVSIPAFAELREMQWEEIHTRVIPDASYEDKSLLIVETALTKLSFESTRGILPGSVEEREPGGWWVKLKPGVQLISISAEGFLPLKEIRHNFVQRQAWAIKVTAKTPEVHELPVVIRVEPSGADVSIDGKATDISGSARFAIGEHSIEIVKSGYVTIKDNFTVNLHNILFEYTLEGDLSDMEFVPIPGGSFLMGSPSNESGRYDNEKQHRVTISGFQMMTTEVTQGMWTAVMGGNPSNWKGDNQPVEQVSWNNCQKFIKKLNQRDPGKNYRLPTEAEWEYACRSGTTTRFYGGDRDSDLDRVGWYDGNSDDKPHPVGQKQANSWGLYDMHGNVCEWCQDWYGDYSSGSVTDPRGPSSGSFGSYRVIRGGGWYSSAGLCRSAIRVINDPSTRDYGLGFRLARDK